MPRPVNKKKYPIPRNRLPIIRDIKGERWHVYERRPTPYGFDIYMGWDASPTAAYRGGKAAVIVTAPLAKHLRATVQRPHALPLPMGRKTLRRVRKEVGVDHRVWIDARINWWLDRIDDLGTLSAAKFVARHGKDPWSRQGTVSTTLVCKMRQLFLGDRARPRGWWKAPAVRALVRSKLRAPEVAERLGVSEITIYRIRRQLRGLPAVG